MLLVYVTGLPALSPNTIPAPPDPQFGPFANAAFLGPLTGSIVNFLALSLFTFTMGGLTGAHLNPLITLSTFCARLCSLPRAVLYIAGQTAGAALAGLLMRASWGGPDFKAGGCWLFSEEVAVGDAFAGEAVTSLAILFLAFGVGLDPHQRAFIPPALAPFLVGGALGTLSFATGFFRYGYGGASMNPARCFGALDTLVTSPSFNTSVFSVCVRG